jgi:uncharacterized protein YggE
MSDTEEPIRTISVSGTVEWEISPDNILWRIALTDTDKDLGRAKSKVEDKVKSVVALQKTLDIEEGDLETGYVQVRREYERDESGHRTIFKHFVVRRSITIVQRDLKRFDEFFDTLLASADMEVDFSFRSSRMADVRSEMRLEALEVAKTKAAGMAGALGVELGRVLTIDEHAQGRPMGARGPIPYNVSVVHSRPSADIATETFLPGTLNEQVTVYVTFELD